MNGRERILAHLDGKLVDHLPCMPITMQFAADLIGVPYKQYATDFRTLVDGQNRVAEAFDFDYVNTMSDPGCEAADCGASVVFAENAPPAIDESHALLAEKARLATLSMPNPAGPGRMQNRLRAMKLHRERAGGERLIEGWIEGPCAEAADLRGINTLMVDFFDDPGFVRELFEFVTEMEIRFARAQVEAGAEMIGIGDAAASLIGPKFYREFVWAYERQMVDAIREMGARSRLHICGNIRRILKDLGELGCDIVDVDFLVGMDEARSAMGPDQMLLGNIDPVRVLREGTPEAIRACLADCHRQAGARYIVGAGCEVTRDTSYDNLRALTGFARETAP